MALALILALTLTPPSPSPMLLTTTLTLLRMYPKVDEVRHWMTLALSARAGIEGACRLLALVGPPGSAKSTMVRLLAQDMDVELAEWQVTQGEGKAGNDGRCSVGGGGEE